MFVTFLCLLCIFCIRCISQAGSTVLSVSSLFRMLQFLWQASTVSLTSSLKYLICVNPTILIASHSVNTTLHYGAGTVNIANKYSTSVNNTTFILYKMRYRINVVLLTDTQYIFVRCNISGWKTSNRIYIDRTKDTSPSKHHHQVSTADVPANTLNM